MKLSAKYIFTGDGNILMDKFIEINDDGVIVKIENIEYFQDIVFFDGIICPAFFNSHTHLELAGYSFQKSNGLLSFLKDIRSQKKIAKNNLTEILKLDKHFYNQGIVFCADTSNTDITLKIKQNSNIEYQNFIEIYEDSKKNINDNFAEKRLIENSFINQNISASIVPHSLYTLSFKLIRILSEYNKIFKNITSIHFKESLLENNIANFQKEIYNKILLNEDINKIQDIIEVLFSKHQRVMFVHNIFMNNDEADFIFKNFSKIAFCLCPSSNINIENKMAPKELVVKYLNNIVLGTDSSVSNKKMSIVEEMFLLQNYYNLDFNDVLKTTTLNPSVFFEKSNIKGIIKIGASPSFANIINFDFDKMKLTKESVSKRINV